MLGVLRYIADHLDPTLGFSYSCRIGLCSSCLARVNGKVVLVCSTLVDGDIIVEPYKDALMVRDVVAELPAVVKLKNPLQDMPSG